MNVESMSKHQHISLFQVWLNVFLIHIRLQLVIDENHNNICFFCSFSCCIHFKSLSLCLCPGLASLIQSNDHMTARLLCIQRMGMSLASVANHCYRLAIQQRQIAVLLIINLCHIDFLLILSSPVHPDKRLFRTPLYCAKVLSPDRSGRDFLTHHALSSPAKNPLPATADTGCLWNLWPVP